MKLSPHEIAYLVLKQGWSATPPAGGGDSEAVLAVATFLAESGGDTEVMARSTTGDNIGNRDHGLTQLSGRWHYPEIQAAGGNWRDPEVNVAIAYQLFVANGRSLAKVWHAFDSGSHTQFLPDARIAVAHPWPLRVWPEPVDELAERMKS